MKQFDSICNISLIKNQVTFIKQNNINSISNFIQEISEKSNEIISENPLEVI